MPQDVSYHLQSSCCCSFLTVCSYKPLVYYALPGAWAWHWIPKWRVEDHKGVSYLKHSCHIWIILKFKLPTLVTKKCIHIWSINFHENAARNVNRRTIAIAKQVSSNVFSTLIDAKRQGENINPIAWATWFTNSIRPNWKLSVFHILHIVKIWII